MIALLGNGCSVRVLLSYVPPWYNCVPSKPHAPLLTPQSLTKLTKKFSDTRFAF